jgi:Undecaprenyl-phosphate galactose phosphotransferase WbaP
LPYADDVVEMAPYTSLPCLHGPNAYEEAAAIAPGSYALLDLSGLSKEKARLTLDKLSTIFSSVMLIPQLMGSGTSLWVSAVDLENSVALLVRQNLLNPTSMFVKRLFDLALSTAFGIVLLPVILVLALIIRLDSPGPAFFRQVRVGKDGKPFSIIKFRTMHPGKSHEEFLAEHPELAEEHKKHFKLRNDPRITRFGKFLRRSSLDELPQLWNVFKGEMALVGPRPILHSEIEKYGETFKFYVRVRPGLTGLWQVSGRSNVTFEQHVAMDNYYVCNWSIWMDNWILLITLPALLERKGAY